MTHHFRSVTRNDNLSKTAQKATTRSATLRLTHQRPSSTAQTARPGPTCSCCTVHEAC